MVASAAFPKTGVMIEMQHVQNFLKSDHRAVGVAVADVPRLVLGTKSI